MSDDLLAASWQRMLDGLAKAGNVVETQLAGRPDAERADAYRAVLRALTANLGKLEADGRFPLPVHVNPPNQKWFVDNPDGITVHCPLDDSQRYRLWGNVGGACYTSITTYEGKGDGLATKATAVRTDRELPIAADGSFSLTLSSAESDDPSHLRLVPGTGQLWIRQLFDDIDHEPPGWFQIENLDPREPPPAVSVDAVASSMKRIGRAMPMLTQTMFGAYRMQVGSHPVNAVRVWTEMQSGAFFTSNDIEYYIGAFELGEDDRLSMPRHEAAVSALEHRPLQPGAQLPRAPLPQHLAHRRASRHRRAGRIRESSSPGRGRKGARTGSIPRDARPGSS